MTAPLTLTAYAKLRGVSHVAVHKAVKSGRLHESVGRNERGQPTIIDVAVADREWEANTRARVDRAGLAAPVDEVPNYNDSRARKEAAAARREAANADMAELDLAERRGELVSAAAAREDVVNAFTIVRTRVMGVPSGVAQRLPHVAAEAVPVMEELLREALEELSGGET